MAADDGISTRDEVCHFERVALEAILDWHPDHLTVPELVMSIAIGGDDRSEAERIESAIRGLKSSGLLRSVGDEVVPTHAARRAGALLLPP